MFATCTSVPDKAKAPHAYRWYIHIAAIKGVRRCGIMKSHGLLTLMETEEQSTAASRLLV